MARPVFQHDSIKKIIGVFASILDEVRFTNGHGEVQEVPLMYSPREKFMEDIIQKPDMDQYSYDITLPRIGFEVTGYNFAPERHTNPLGKIKDNQGNFTHNRIPYDFSVTVYLAATRMNDGNRIVEQIIPFFTPEFTVTMKDIEELGLETNVSIILNSVTHDAQYEGSFDSARVLTWELQFTVKAFLYQNIISRERIKKTIVDLVDKDYDKIYERLTSTVTPTTANEDDPHTIVDEILFPDGPQ